MKPGLVHLYYGDGKGKTTAALGLALRSAGCGKRVIFAQFMKGNVSSELTILKKIPEISVVKVPEHLGFYREMQEESREKLRDYHNQILETLLAEKEKQPAPELIVLDEVTYAYTYHLMEERLFTRLLNEHGETEIVMTGRNPAPYLQEMADYMTEMKCRKHPYEKGVPARKGIEY